MIPSLDDIRSELALFRPSTTALVAGNVLPLVLAPLLGWSVFGVLLLYWLENVIIGVYNVLRMATCQPLDPASWLLRLMLIPFFCLHYGGFCAGHGVFIVMMFGGAMQPSGDLAIAGHVLDELSSQGIWIAAAGLAVSHAVSLVVNWFGRAEYRDTELTTLMMRPYLRIVVLHVALVLGGIPVMLTGSHWFAVALLIALKTAIDLVAHWAERHALETAPAPTTA